MPGSDIGDWDDSASPSKKHGTVNPAALGLGSSVPSSDAGNTSFLSSLTRDDNGAQDETSETELPPPDLTSVTRKRPRNEYLSDLDNDFASFLSSDVLSAIRFSKHANLNTIAEEIVDLEKRQEAMRVIETSNIAELLATTYLSAVKLQNLIGSLPDQCFRAVTLAQGFDFTNIIFREYVRKYAKKRLFTTSWLCYGQKTASIPLNKRYIETVKKDLWADRRMIPGIGEYYVTAQNRNTVKLADNTLESPFLKCVGSLIRDVKAAVVTNLRENKEDYKFQSLADIRNDLIAELMPEAYPSSTELASDAAKQLRALHCRIEANYALIRLAYFCRTDGKEKEDLWSTIDAQIVDLRKPTDLINSLYVAVRATDLEYFDGQCDKTAIASLIKSKKYGWPSKVELQERLELQIRKEAAEATEA